MRIRKKRHEELRRYIHDNDIRISELENRIKHHADMIYNKKKKGEES